MSWTVYIIEATDGSLYTGITTDLERRFSEHRSGTGAKFFRGRLPKSVLYSEDASNRSAALRREAGIKRMTRRQKLALIRSGASTL